MDKPPAPARTANRRNSRALRTSLSASPGPLSASCPLFEMAATRPSASGWSRPEMMLYRRKVASERCPLAAASIEEDTREVRDDHLDRLVFSPERKAYILPVCMVEATSGISTTSCEGT